MATRKYPYIGWVLTPSYKPKQVQFVSAYASWGNKDYGDNSEGGKTYRIEDIRTTLEDIIALGRERLDKQQADLNKRGYALHKRRTALDKASA